MGSLGKGWGKIYLAYGMIFFSLGLTARLSQPDFWDRLRVKSAQYWRDIRVYADLPIPSGLEFPVFQELWTIDRIYLFYPDQWVEQQQELWREIQLLFGEYSYSQGLILYPLSGNDMVQRLLTVDAPSSAILIGLQVKPAIPSGIQAELNFNLPETRVEETLGRLGQLALNQVQARKFRQKSQVIYQLRWLSEDARVVADFRQVLAHLLRLGGKRV